MEWLFIFVFLLLNLNEELLSNISRTSQVYPSFSLCGNVRISIYICTSIYADLSLHLSLTNTYTYIYNTYMHWHDYVYLSVCRHMGNVITHTDRYIRVHNSCKDTRWILQIVRQSIHWTLYTPKFRRIINQMVWNFVAYGSHKLKINGYE